MAHSTRYAMLPVPLPHVMCVMWFVTGSGGGAPCFRNLTQDQREGRPLNSGDMIDGVDTDPGILNRIITGSNFWILNPNAKLHNDGHSRHP